MPRFEEMLLYLKSKKAVPLKDIVEIKSKKSAKLKDKKAKIRYIEITDINSEGSEISSATSITVSDAPSRASYDLETDEIITEVAGVSTGTQNHATAIVTDEFSGAICTNGFRVLKSTKINPYFLLYYLKSDLFLNQMLKCRIGAAIPSVLEEDLGKILVLLPNEDTILKISQDMKRLFKLKAEVRKETDRLLSKDNNMFSKYK
jgi:type I restriction enzyme M protein